MYREKEIMWLLWSFGINKKYLGFEQTAYGLELLTEDKARLKNITKDIYPDIARKLNTSSENVERNIRTLVEIIWDFGNRELLQGNYTVQMEHRPTNTEFFAILMERLPDSMEQRINIKAGNIVRENVAG